MYWARSAKTTPESLMRYIEAHRPEGRAAGERAKLIDTVADQLNHLSYEERRELRVSRKLDAAKRSGSST